MSRSFIILLLCFSWLSAFGARAYVPTWIGIGPNGTLSGLPAEFEPASLKVEIRSDSYPRVVVELSGNEVTLPRCLSTLFDIPDDEEISLGAYFSHSELGPPSLTIMLPENSVSLGFYEGWSITFGLKSAAVLSIRERRFLERRGKTVMGSGSRNLDELCSVEEIQSLSPRRSK